MLQFVSAASISELLGILDLVDIYYHREAAEAVFSSKYIG